MTKKELNPFSNENLEKMLDELSWQQFGDEAKEICKISKAPYLIQAFLRSVGKFELGGNFYSVIYGTVYRYGNVKVKPQDIGEKIAYTINGVAVKFQEITAKLGEKII